VAAITSTTTGNASAGATWVGGVAPSMAGGDTIVVATGHVVTQDVNGDYGTSPATGGAAAVTINGTGKLIVAAGVTLKARGDILLGATSASRTSGFYQLDLLAGSVLEFDASAATTPASQTYVCGPTQSASPNARVRFQGSAASRCTVRSNAGGGNGRFSNRGFNTRLGSLTATYTDFLRVGDASNDAFQLYLSSTTTETDTFSLANCTLTACGRVATAASLSTGTVVSLTDVVFSGTVSTSCFRVAATPVVGTGTWQLTRVVLDKILGDTASPPVMRDFTFTDCWFDGSWSLSASGANQQTGLWLRCGLRKSEAGASAHQGTGTIFQPGTMQDCLFWHDIAGNTNNKWLSANPQADLSLTGCLWLNENADTTGDFMSVGIAAASSPRRVTLRNNLCPNNAGSTGRPGTLISFATAGTGWDFVVEHNTWVTASESVIAIGETATTAANQFSSYKSNLAVGLGGTGSYGPYHVHDIAAGGPSTDALPGTACLNNAATTGVTAGAKGRGFNMAATAAPDATNLFGTAVAFVDRTRRLDTWDAALGGPGTTAGARARFAADPTQVDGARQWVRAGWATTDATLRNAGHDGVTTGAVEGVFGIRRRRLLTAGGN
jgi:hypothetical protein